MKTKTNDKRDQRSESKPNQTTKQEGAKKETNSKNTSMNSDRKSAQSAGSKRK